MRVPSPPLAAANTRYANRRLAGCVLVSDNQSWVGVGRGGSTGVMTQWQTFVRNQIRRHDRDWAGPNLVCIDLQPYTTTQAPDRSDVLNVGGFSDAVFSVVAAFLADDGARFVRELTPAMAQELSPLLGRASSGKRKPFLARRW